MASEKRIETCIGTDEAKHLRARLSLLVVDGARVTFRHYHSINIEPGADLAHLRAVNEAHLANPDGSIPDAPWPKIPDDQWADVEAHVAIVHKPVVVQAFRAERAAREAEAKAQRETHEKQVADQKAADEARFRQAVADEVAKIR